MRCPVPARLYLRRARRGHAATWVIKDQPNVEISTGLRQSDRLGAEKALLSYLANKHWGQQKQIGRNGRAATRCRTAAHETTAQCSNVVRLPDRRSHWNLDDFF